MSLLEFGDFDCQQSVALGLHLFDLGYHQFESVELATDLPLQMFWQCAAVAGPQFLKPMSPITSQRLVVGDPLSKQQAFGGRTPAALRSDGRAQHGC